MFKIFIWSLNNHFNIKRMCDDEDHKAKVEDYKTYPSRWYILIVYATFACLQVGFGKWQRQDMAPPPPHHDSGPDIQHVGPDRPECQDCVLLEWRHGGLDQQHYADRCGQITRPVRLRWLTSLSLQHCHKLCWYDQITGFTITINDWYLTPPV